MGKLSKAEVDMSAGPIPVRECPKGLWDINNEHAANYDGLKLEIHSRYRYSLAHWAQLVHDWIRGRCLPPREPKVTPTTVYPEPTVNRAKGPQTRRKTA
jgi:hypothetical protein